MSSRNRVCKTIKVVATLSALSASMPLSTPPGQAAQTSEIPLENRGALRDIARPLKTRLPQATDKYAPRYMKELDNAQRAKPVGSLPLTKVTVPAADGSIVDPAQMLTPQGRIIDAAQQQQSNSTTELAPVSNTSANPAPANPDTVNATAAGASDENTSVDIRRPPLKALISIQKNLNPFHLDAEYSEHINLPEVLNQSVSQNLAIEGDFAALKAQQYRFLSAASGFLPDITSSYSLYGIKGELPGALLGGPGQAAVKLPGSIQLLSAGFKQNLYQGGAVVFSTLEQRHRYRANRAQLKGSVNDVLLETARRYYDVLLNEAILEIRTRAVEISEEQVRLNSAQEKSGAATGLDVLQSQAQLASDQQNLVDQQNTRRQSALQLANYINASLGQDLVSSEPELKKKRLLPIDTDINRLLGTAIDNRPELRQYEELRLAARRAVVRQAAPLQPRVAVAGSVFGVGANGNRLDPLYNISLSVNWALGHLGTTDLANIQQAKWEARQAAVRAKQTFTDVFTQVRSSYDSSLAADKRIKHASAQIAAAEEELRIATKRMQAGIGLNIDVLNAQRDRTQASINKARALVDFNVAQAQLLRDVGLITVNGLTTGVKIQ